MTNKYIGRIYRDVTGMAWECVEVNPDGWAPDSSAWQLFKRAGAHYSPKKFFNIKTGKHYYQDNPDLIIPEEKDMYTDTPYISTNYLTKVEDDKENFVIVNKSGGGILGSATTLEEAKTKAQKSLKQDSDYYIFQAVARVTPKPLDADIEEL